MKLTIKLGVLAVLMTALPLLTSSQKAEAGREPSPLCLSGCYSTEQTGIANCSAEYSGNQQAESACIGGVERGYFECISGCGLL